MLPLADRLRPRTLGEVFGQKHLIGPGAMLRNIIESGEIPNLIFYGPPGTGKTTVARIIADSTEKRLHILNGTSAALQDIKDIAAEIDTIAAPNGILLYLDEIQYFNKKQQQSLLQYIENGSITLIASTTENPFFYVHPAVLSRSTAFEFKSLTPADAVPGIKRAFACLIESGEPAEIDDEVVSFISVQCAGDMRKAVTMAEMAYLGAPRAKDGEIKKITLENASLLATGTGLHYDSSGDEHYDMISAFQKSMRGSDPDAAVYYLARILEGGDLLSACRRLMVCANEDVGLAYPMIIPIVKAAVDTALQVGLPEARIPLANAVVLVATSPKSNSAYNAVNAALSDIKTGLTGPVPRQLQNVHADSAEVKNPGQNYLYPHVFDNHWVKQQYLPDCVKDRKYYKFGENKTEQAAKAYWDIVKGK